MENKLKLLSIGNYEVSSLTLGEGSFSKVKVARHKVLNKYVAIKIIKKTSIKDSYVAKNLERESKIMSTLYHQNVVRLFEVSKCKGFYCLIMEYCSGGSLCDLVQNNGKLPEDKAKFFFRQMIQGLHYIHGKGIIHRDLKLENVLLNQDHSNLMIADFGLSNFWSPGTQLATHCGSPEYAAPELFIKSYYTNKIDIWSAGIVLYAMLTAQLPFDIKSGVKHHLKLLVKAVNNGLVEYHRRKLVHTSIELKLLLSKMLCVAHDQRISLENIWKDAWVTEDGLTGKDTLLGIEEGELSEEETRLIIRRCREKLSLHHTTSDNILRYVRSDEGWFGKTAGCFNILRKDFEQLKICSAESKTVKQVHIKPAQLQSKEEVKNIDGGIQDICRSATDSKRIKRSDPFYVAGGSQRQSVKSGQGKIRAPLEGSQGTAQSSRGSPGISRSTERSQETSQPETFGANVSQHERLESRRGVGEIYESLFQAKDNPTGDEHRQVKDDRKKSYPVYRKIVGRAMNDVQVSANTRVLRTPRSGKTHQFWYSSEGKRVVEALKRFNHPPGNAIKSKDSSNSPESKIRRTESKEAVMVKRKILKARLSKQFKIRGGTSPAQISARSTATSAATSVNYDQENRDINTWRRSVCPKKLGEGKHTRLKRVEDNSNKGTLRNRDLNRVH